MLAFIVTLRGGRRYTVQADELRVGADGALELVAAGTGAAPGPRVVALFDRNDVVSVVSREHLISEEPGEAAPHTVSRLDPIPF